MWTEEAPLSRERGCPPTALLLRPWCFCGAEEAPLRRGKDCPPTALLPHLWCFCGRHVLKTCWEFSGKPWGTNKSVKSPHNPVLEAEGNLNPHKPLGCLLSQCSLSRGDISDQLVGFGMGEAACWGSMGNTGIMGCGGGAGVSWRFAFPHFLRAL